MKLKNSSWKLWFKNYKLNKRYTREYGFNLIRVLRPKFCLY